MCTVIVEVPASAQGSTRLFAVRDEDPTRPWDAPGPWWPERPGVVGVRDRRAGGAWLAVAEGQGRLAVLLNRAEHVTPDAPGLAGAQTAPTDLKSRGGLVLDAVSGMEVADPPGTAAFNLVSVHGGLVEVTSWDGHELLSERLKPGLHMIAHHGVDDPCSARIETWLPEFQRLAGAGDDWRERWVELLTVTTALPVSDDRAIIRDNHAHGYPTASLLACLAEIDGDTVQLDTAVFARPAKWGTPIFETLAL